MYKCVKLRSASWCWLFEWIQKWWKSGDQMTASVTCHTGKTSLPRYRKSVRTTHPPPTVVTHIGEGLRMRTSTCLPITYHPQSTKTWLRPETRTCRSPLLHNTSYIEAADLPPASMESQSGPTKPMWKRLGSDTVAWINTSLAIKKHYKRMAKQLTR